MSDTPTDDDIEITPEMLKAGAEAVAAYDERFEQPTDCANEVYLAMERARRGIVLPEKPRGPSVHQIYGRDD
jgi:hypothetical protein